MLTIKIKKSTYKSIDRVWAVSVGNRGCTYFGPNSDLKLVAAKVLKTAVMRKMIAQAENGIEVMQTKKVNEGTASKLYDTFNECLSQFESWNKAQN